MITAYGLALSGNCWKVAHILRLAGHPFRWVETDSNAGHTRTPEFLARNPAGKVPVVELDDGTILTESNAILTHFADATPWLPPPGLPRTRVMEWLFFEQNNHEPYVAGARQMVAFLDLARTQPERLASLHASGARALGLMEHRLSAHPWLTDLGPTIADLALFAYTHVAGDGGFDLARYPAIQAWIARFAALPGIEPMAPTPPITG